MWCYKLFKISLRQIGNKIFCRAFVLRRTCILECAINFLTENLFDLDRKLILDPSTRIKIQQPVTA
jgi:hypothetical protein